MISNIGRCSNDCVVNLAVKGLIHSDVRSALAPGQGDSQIAADV